MGCTFCRHPIPLGSHAAAVHNAVVARTGERSYGQFNSVIYADAKTLLNAPRRAQVTPEEETRFREAMVRNRRPRALSVAVVGVLIG